MNKKKMGMVLSFAIAAGTLLGACGKTEEKEVTTGKNDFSVSMVTDIGGVDDKSFNQSAWEGLQEFGKENNLVEGAKGYTYLQSKSDADYSTNLNTLARQDSALIIGIGFMMQGAVDEIAQQQKDSNFAIIDAEVKQPNVASVLFKEHEASFLAGVAAGMTTKTNKIGFIGGIEGAVIERFEAGFVAGVKSANPNATVDVKYAGAFDKAELGQTISSTMYSSGADIVFHAAGATGNGLFKEATDLKKKDPAREIWAIGVDRDQSDMGPEVVLTSALKRVDVAVKDVATKSKDGNFPGGEVALYGLAEDGVGVAPINEKVANKTDIEAKIQEWIEKIKSGDVKVPGTRAELKKFTVNQ